MIYLNGHVLIERQEYFNTKLEKVLKTFKHGTIVKVDPIREHFTGHGLHLNTQHNEALTTQLVIIIKILLQRSDEILKPMYIRWKHGNNDNAVIQGFTRNISNSFLF